MSTGKLRFLVFIGAASVALAAACMLAVGGFLTMKPALVSEQAAEILRARSIVALLISGVLALLTVKSQWLRQILGQ